jgi:hypothetical protein
VRRISSPHIALYTRSIRPSGAWIAEYVLELTDDNKAELTDEHVAGLAQVGDPTATDEGTQ